MKKLIIFLMLVAEIFALTPKEAKALNYMYQEEKLAKDVYYTLGKMYPQVRVFNIYRSEVMHENSIANVMKHYGLSLPVRGDEVGVFTNTKLQNLYNQLIEKGKHSLTDALEVGIMVEVTDVDDLDEFLQTATSPDVIALFKFLRSGSYNHYNGFNRTFQAVTGKSACELMSDEWCKNYPFQRGIGRYYARWYWFAKRAFR